MDGSEMTPIGPETHATRQSADQAEENPQPSPGPTTVANLPASLNSAMDGSEMTPVEPGTHATLLSADQAEEDPQPSPGPTAIANLPALDASHEDQLQPSQVLIAERSGTAIDDDAVSLPPSSTRGPDPNPSVQATATIQSIRPSSSASRSYSIRFLLLEWRWEIFTWVLGTLALLVIVLLLLVFRGKQLNAWRGNVQISAVIAIFSQVAQSALIVSVSACIGQLKWSHLRQKRRAIEIERYDEASRGLEGSLKLFLRTVVNHWRHKGGLESVPLLVLLGTLISLLMLGLGPFVQQSVSIIPNDVPESTRAASITRGVYYNLTSASDDYILGDEPSSDTNADIYLTQAVNSGMGPDQSLSEVTGNCPTADCSWTPYTSLGVCLSTEDISSTLVDKSAQANMSRPNYVKNLTVAELDSLPGYTRDSGQISDTEEFWMGAVSMMPRALDNPAFFHGRPPSTIADVYVIYLPPCAVWNNTPGSANDSQSSGQGREDQWLQARNETKNWRAFRGTLSLCIRDFNSSIARGVPRTTVLSRRDDFIWKYFSRSWYSNPSSPVVYDEWVEGRAGNESYYMSLWGMEAIGARLRTVFNGTASLKFGGDNYYTSPSILTVVGDMYGPNPIDCSLDPGLGIHGFEKRLSNVAISLTNTIRTSNNGIETIYGISYSTEQFINADLKWLSLPIIVWFTVTFFFFATVWKSRTKVVPLWKSSPLPLLDCADPNNQLGSRREIKQQARLMSVQLQSDGGAWHLVRTT